EAGQGVSGNGGDRGNVFGGNGGGVTTLRGGIDAGVTPMGVAKGYTLSTSTLLRGSGLGPLGTGTGAGAETGTGAGAEEGVWTPPGRGMSTPPVKKGGTLRGSRDVVFSSPPLAPFGVERAGDEEPGFSLDQPQGGAHGGRGG
ncbi:unnamed protein product, partial [Discosporangium mesarthrocarpum]